MIIFLSKLLVSCLIMAPCPKVRESAEECTARMGEAVSTSGCPFILRLDQPISEQGPRDVAEQEMEMEVGVESVRVAICPRFQPFVSFQV